MGFTFGCATKLYENQIHPRVLLGPPDLETLRQRCKRGVHRKILAQMRRRSEPIVDSIYESTDLGADLAAFNVKWTNPGSYMIFGLLDIATVGVLDEDDRFIEAVRRTLLAFPDAEEQGRQEPMRRFGHSANEIGGARAYDLIAPYLSKKERRAITDWMVECGIRKFLEVNQERYHIGPGGNMILGGMLSAWNCLLAIKGDPGVPSLRREEASLLKCLKATLFSAIGPEGYPEEDIGYGTSCAGMIAEVAESLHRAGIYDVYKECPRYAAFGDAMLHFVQPWGKDLSNTGDHGDDFGRRELILARQAQQLQRPDLLWLLQTLNYHGGVLHTAIRHSGYYDEVKVGRDKQIPASLNSLLFADTLKDARPPSKVSVPTHYRDSARGIVTFRSGWGADDSLVVFDGSQRSPAAPGHAHASCGHFSFSALGEYFSIDTGRYNIEQDQHSVVLVDGKSGRSSEGDWVATPQAGRLTTFAPGDFVDFAAVDSSHQHNCYWAQRSLGLVKGNGAPGYLWIVDDINKHNDWAEYWWQLQTSPENKIRLGDRKATITGFRQGNKADVHLCLLAPKTYARPHSVTMAQDTQQTCSTNYITSPLEQHKPYSRPADMLHGPCYWRPRLLAKVKGYNGRFLSLVIPRYKGERAARVRQLPTLPMAFAVRVTFSNVEDTIIFAYEHHQLEADDIVGCGQWCVVRRSRRNGRVLAYQLHAGHALAVGKRSILP